MEEFTNETWLKITNGEEEVSFVYFYTPMCGTCQVASTMLNVIQSTIQNITLYKCNLNYFSEIAKQYEIESVPCLTIWQKGYLHEKVYAFQSVQYIYNLIKKYHESIR